MKNKNSSLIPELREIFMAGDAKHLRDFCETGHPAFVSELISAVSGDEAWAVIGQVKISRLIQGTPPENKTHSYTPGWNECRNSSVWRIAP
jgi:hypothetical protein